jgi:hypothetical protein
VTAELLDASRLIVPALDARPWPSLGGHVCRHIREHLVHGPGDVMGQPAELTEEMEAFIWRAYEVYPKSHKLAGRRRFKRVALFRRKGYAKTEIAAWIAEAELDPEAPVRTVGWRRATAEDIDEGYSRGEWVPIGGPVLDPYIPLIATTEEQSDELAFTAVREVLLNCERGNLFDVGLERITPRGAPGKLQALAGSPTARDGARTTFQLFDEPHHMVSERVKAAHRTMLRNMPKRVAADAWTLYTSTMYEPGAGSIAEGLHAYAVDVALGRVDDPTLYFDHRQAALIHDLSRRRELIRAIEEASGDALAFADVPAIAQQYLEPDANRPEFRRFWLNQRWKSARRWLDPGTLRGLVAAKRYPGGPPEGTRVVLAFDGSYQRDSTALIGSTVEAVPHVFAVRVWEKPLSAPVGSWRTPRNEVDSVVADAMERWDVVELAPDPPGWHREVEDWEATYGAPPVVRFETNQPSRMGPAADTFENAVKEHDLTLDGSEALMRHLSNCIVTERRGYHVPTKSSADSPDKIDAGIGAVVSYARAMWHVLQVPDEPFVWRAV